MSFQPQISEVLIPVEGQVEGEVRRFKSLHSVYVFHLELFDPALGGWHLSVDGAWLCQLGRS